MLNHWTNRNHQYKLKPSMYGKPWDQPATPEGREELIRIARIFEAEGKVREYAWTVTKLSHILKWSGTGRVELDTFTWMKHLSGEAVENFRKTDDKVGLATALRERAHPMISGVDHDALLHEALQLSIEAGDISGQGWALHAMSLRPSDIDNPLEKAIACFEAAGNRGGIAVANQRLGIKHRDGTLFVQSAEIFLELGEFKEAYRAFIMAAVFGSDHFSSSEREQILIKALELAENHCRVQDEYHALTMLSNLMKDTGNLEARRMYLAKRRKLRYKPPKFED